MGLIAQKPRAVLTQLRSLRAVASGWEARLEKGISLADDGFERDLVASMQAINTAAIRAAKAWSVRNDTPEAWREVSRMFGVLLRFLPPGEGPTDPIEMVTNLRRPLREWVPLDWSRLPADAGSFPILGSDDDLTAEAVEYGSDYTEALFEDHEATSDWIPRWAAQTIESVERKVFQVLKAAGQEQYVATRQMLIEVPAGTRSEILEQYNARDALRSEAYIPLPPDQQFRTDDRRWYVPCPECGWPMHVRGALLRCRFPQHRGQFTVTSLDSPGGPVVAGPVNVLARDAADVRALHYAVWRYITIPGVTEVALMRWLAKHAGVTIERWPHKDRWDVTARIGAMSLHVDLKDVRYPAQVAMKLPHARYVVVPDYRAWQIPQLKRSLPKDRFTPCTVRSFKVIVKKALEDAS